MAKKTTCIGRYCVEDARPYKSGQELSLRELAGYERRAARTILREVKNVEPEVLSYARRALGLTQTQLATHLGVKKETVSRWENGSEPYKPTVPLALATLLDRAERAGGDVTKLPLREVLGKKVMLKAS